MSNSLSKNLFRVNQHAGTFKPESHYDIYDPDTNEIVFKCREESINAVTKAFRLTGFKLNTPFDIFIRDIEGKQVIRVRRKAKAVGASKIQVLDGENLVIGKFHQELFSLQGKFSVLNPEGEKIFTLKGKWTGWDYTFMQEGQVIAEVNKRWAGLKKELFTTADNYLLKIAEGVPTEGTTRKLILASVICIDMIFSE